MAQGQKTLPTNECCNFVRQYGPKLLYTAIGFIAGLACFITSSYKGYGVEFDILSYLLNHRLYELIAYDFFDFICGGNRCLKLIPLLLLSLFSLPSALPSAAPMLDHQYPKGSWQFILAYLFFACRAIAQGLSVIKILSLLKKCKTLSIPNYSIYNTYKCIGYFVVSLSTIVYTLNQRLDAADAAPVLLCPGGNATITPCDNDQFRKFFVIAGIPTLLVFNIFWTIKKLIDYYEDFPKETCETRIGHLLLLVAAGFSCVPAVVLMTFPTDSSAWIAFPWDYSESFQTCSQINAVFIATGMNFFSSIQKTPEPHNDEDSFLQTAMKSKGGFISILMFLFQSLPKIISRICCNREANSAYLLEDNAAAPV